MMLDASILTVLLAAGLSGTVTGLVTFGAISVKLAWLRADVESSKGDIRHAHKRIDAILYRQPDPPPARRAEDAGRE